jgi:DNA polymerase III subunit gamma/tau
LNILNEAEINFKSARNKRLHVELAIIKLCYLQQAMQLTATGGGLDKKKIVDESRAVAFKNIAPIAVSLTTEVKPSGVKAPAPPPEQTAKLTIETPAVKQMPKQEPVAESIQSSASAVRKEKTKLGSLDSLRKKIGESAAGQENVDKPLEQASLEKAWKDFIVKLKASKNSAWQSFESAELKITDDSSFEAIVDDNIYQQFLLKERNNVCPFLQKELHNRKLKFSVVLTESKIKREPTDLPLSSKEQYQKLVEQFPLVKELKDRLRLELDY